jgi:dihydroxyacid dehydratase/phosphogluconate dehydratase
MRYTSWKISTLCQTRRTSREFTPISVSDDIAMGHERMKASLVSLGVIADSIELMMNPSI